MKTADEFLKQLKRYMQDIQNDPAQVDGLDAEYLAKDILKDIEQFEAEQKQVRDE